MVEEEQAAGAGSRSRQQEQAAFKAGTATAAALAVRGRWGLWLSLITRPGGYQLAYIFNSMHV
jgi:hypothetical protein